jgi:PAS domain S-box-containing protein
MMSCCALFFAGAVCWSVVLLSRAERAQALTESRVREGEEHLQIAIETARLGSWQVDLTTGTLEGSTRYKTNFGLDPDAPIIIEELRAAMHPDDRAPAQSAFDRAIATRGEYHSEYRVVWPDGSTHWLVASGRAIYDDAGIPLRAVGVTLDVTAERNIAAERERLLEIERRARAQSEQANRMKDEFLATLSHELRTPLSAIFGWAQILRRPNTKPETLADGLAAIERNARVQTQIIGDLLDMGSILNGKVSLDARTIDLATAVNAAIATVRPTATAKEITIAFEPPSGARYPMVGDVNRLQQVFWNLLSNAIKFTPRGGRVEVRIDQRHSLWQVDVIDSGEGIAPEFLPFVFDRFSQADASTTRTHGGLGLGLAIVKQLVELHGGKARAHSAGLGVGSTFVVSLPVRVTHDSPIPPSLQSASGTDSVPGDLLAATPEDGDWDPTLSDAVRGKTVLIVDDEPDARAVLKQLMTDCMAKVLVAASAEEALEIIEATPPDILISDIGMPGSDGYDLIRKVRQREAGKRGRLPAIALTAYARTEDRMKVIRAGFQTHVPKPVEPAELLTVIGGLLEHGT